MSKLAALIILIMTAAPLTASGFPVPRLPFAPLSYTCHRTDEPLTIDGKMTESAWLKAPWTESFVDIEGDLRPLPFYETRVKMLHDDRGIYFFAHLEEEHIWGTLTERDAVIFYDNDFEIFTNLSQLSNALRDNEIAEKRT